VPGDVQRFGKFRLERGVLEVTHRTQQRDGFVDALRVDQQFGELPEWLRVARSRGNNTLLRRDRAIRVAELDSNLGGELL